ncbi:Fpg/Nei family DNA glycosylase [Gorillibacterium massiliense]|uniref:Fpg/Nei family DNA glycosylase n=1 Tax=Gorillibacterium massiliense TaxID=1280390 RepID=UPI0004B50807|nr:DNA-formamidopyrimidine glycosylase family protein [Gorillibacterium massiliense]
MPEMPEMETYRQQLIPRIVGRPLTQVEVTREHSINVPVSEFIKRVSGKRITDIRRRGKHLLFLLDSKDILLLHLMLGGSLFWGRDEDKPKRTVQVRLSFGEEHLHFIGLRLGYLHLVSAAEAKERLDKLGPEALEFTAASGGATAGANNGAGSGETAKPGLTEAEFNRLVAEKRGKLKVALTDQSFLAGIGNCYSDEICFAARILPVRTLQSLQAAEKASLYRSISAVLGEGVRAGGYMEMPLYVGDQLTGGFNALCRVYDRAYEPCLRCGAPLVRRDIGSRKSFCCESCQS